MAHNNFGIPPEGGNNPSSNNFQTSTLQPPPGDCGQAEAIQGPRPDSSPPLHEHWDEGFSDSEVDEEFDRYMEVVNNENAAVAPAPQVSLGKGQQPSASWQADAPLWGPGINSEIIPAGLLPLYTDIPPQFQTREYWTLLVAQARNDIFVTSRACVDEMVRLLNLPSTSPEALFGWTRLSAQWRMFFQINRGFRPGNLTPEVWISMVRHLHTCTPWRWQDQPKPATSQSGPVEQGDPAGYISQYLPTIQTGASLFSVNPDAAVPSRRTSISGGRSSWVGWRVIQNGGETFLTMVHRGTTKMGHNMPSASSGRGPTWVLYDALEIDFLACRELPEPIKTSG